MCKGSKEGKRGYTCGLWALFHSLSTRVEPEENGGSLWISAIRQVCCFVSILSLRTSIYV